MGVTQLQQRRGSANSIFDVKEENHPSKSVFNYSQKRFGTIDFGFYPIDLIEVYPGDNIDLSIQYLLDTQPLVVAPMTGYNFNVEYYYISKSALWRGWDNFITKGAQGDNSLVIPHMLPYYDSFGPHDLSTMLGLPCFAYNPDVNFPDYLPFAGSDSNGVGMLDALPTYVPALSGHSISTNFSVCSLPFLFYQKIWRDTQAPINLMRNNTVWFPTELMDEWRFNYSASNENDRFFAGSELATSVNFSIYNVVPICDNDTSKNDTCVDLLMLRYPMYGIDRFTSARSWLVRGEETSIDATGTLSATLNGLLNVQPIYTLNGSSHVLGDARVLATNVRNMSSTGEYSLDPFIAVTGSSSPYYNYGSYPLAVDVSKSSLNVDNFTMNFTANTLRNLLAMSVWQERNALVAGKYNPLTYVHWGVSPKHPDWEPQYLGGTSQDVYFGNVVQNSASSTDGTPQGTQTGLGNTNGTSHIFSRSFNDYGYIMGVCYVVPEVTYNQGVDRMWTDLTFDKVYQPEFAKLGFEPILNREIYFSGIDLQDNGLFGYQTRGYHLKNRNNSTFGLMSLPPDVDSIFSAYSQSRWFTELPKLSPEFVIHCPQNQRRDFMAYENQPLFRMQYASNVKLTRALPYQSTPATFGF